MGGIDVSVISALLKVARKRLNGLDRIEIAVFPYYESGAVSVRVFTRPPGGIPVMWKGRTWAGRGESLRERLNDACDQVIEELEGEGDG